MVNKLTYTPTRSHYDANTPAPGECDPISIETARNINMKDQWKARVLTFSDGSNVPIQVRTRLEVACRGQVLWRGFSRLPSCVCFAGSCSGQQSNQTRPKLLATHTRRKHVAKQIRPWQTVKVLWKEG